MAICVCVNRTTDVDPWWCLMEAVSGQTGITRGGSATFKVVRPGSRCGWVWLKRGIVTISKFSTY